MVRFFATLGFVAAVLSAGCAEEGAYIYRPVHPQGGATGKLSGLYAVRYAPEGKSPWVTVASTGVAETTADDAKVRVLFVRMVVDNRGGDAEWTLDTRKQRAMLAGASGPLGLGYVNSYKSAVPAIRVAPGEARTVDLYYRLEQGADSAEDIPKFDLEWTVEAGPKVLSHVTTFVRSESEPTYRDRSYGVGYVTPGYYRFGYGPGPRYGWYDGYGPGFGYGYGGYPYWGGGYWGGGGFAPGYGGGGFGGGRSRPYIPASPGVRP